MLIITTTTTTTNKNNLKPLSLLFANYLPFACTCQKTSGGHNPALQQKKNIVCPCFVLFFQLVHPPFTYFLLFLNFFLWECRIFGSSLFFLLMGYEPKQTPFIKRFRKQLTTTSSIAAAAPTIKIWHVDEEYNRLRERDRGIFPQLQKKKKKGNKPEKSSVWQLFDKE